MKRTFIALAVITTAAIIATLVLACTASAQTTYTQTNRVCFLDQCTKAEFNPQALLSFYIPKFGPPVFNGNVETQNFPALGSTSFAYWCTGSLTCAQAEYSDFAGTLTRTIHSSNPNCPVSVACYELQGTFNGGRNTVDEKWQCFRSCGDTNNISGSVTVQ